ncbi:MAG: hypothetical protein WDN04_21645 [Rhodospirillales bacterium]
MISWNKVTADLANDRRAVTALEYGIYRRRARPRADHYLPELRHHAEHADEHDRQEHLASIFRVTNAAVPRRSVTREAHWYGGALRPVRHSSGGMRRAVFDAQRPFAIVRPK